MGTGKAALWGEAGCADPLHTLQLTHPMHTSVRSPACPLAAGIVGRYLASMHFHWSGRMIHHKSKDSGPPPPR